LVDFYDEAEIMTAKELLHNELEKISSGLPRLVRRKVGDNKCRLDVDDIFSMMVRADEAGIMTQLPVFAAARLNRVPHMKPEDLDVCLIAKKLTALQELVEKHVVGASNHSSDQRSPETGVTDVKLTYQHDRDAVPDDKGATPVYSTSLKESYANLAKRPAQSTVLTGTSTGASKQGKVVKAVKRRLVAFAGRLDLATSEDDLQQWLVESGIKDVYCTRIKPKDGKKYPTAAFRVSCSAEYRELFYNESSWPDGCELREWFFSANRSSPAGVTAPQVASQLSTGQSSAACDADGFTTVTHNRRRPSGSAASNSKTSEDGTV